MLAVKLYLRGGGGGGGVSPRIKFNFARLRSVFRAISEYYFCGIRSPIDIMESKSDKLAKHVAYN